ncbi:MAG: hypothetical protein ACREOE_21060, partial [Gemmatimonadales bacterium]
MAPVEALVTALACGAQCLRHAAAVIDEEAKCMDFGNLALSPQCGFASVAEGGNRLTEDEQFARAAPATEMAASAPAFR